MLWFLILVIIIIVGVALIRIVGNLTGDADEIVCGAGIVLIALSGLAIVFSLIYLPIGRMEDRANIEKYYAVKETLEEARENGNEYEKATVINEVIKMNKDLRALQYWNKTMFDWFTVDEVDDLEMIK